MAPPPSCADTVYQDWPSAVGVQHQAGKERPMTTPSPPRPAMNARSTATPRRGGHGGVPTRQTTGTWGASRYGDAPQLSNVRRMKMNEY